MKKTLLVFTFISAVLSSNPACAVNGWEWINPYPVGQALNSVWCGDADDAFAVGYYGVILYFDGTAWSLMESNTDEDLFGIWGSSSSNVYAVGRNGTILHYIDGRWRVESSGTTQTLFDVWGSDTGNIFAVGANGTILHYGGSQNGWQPSLSGVLWNLRSIFGLGPNAVYAAGLGTGKKLLKFDGSGWNQIDQNQLDDLNDVWVSPDGSVFLGGNDFVSGGGNDLAWSADGSDGSFSLLAYEGGSVGSVWGTASDSMYFLSQELNSGTGDNFQYFDGTRTQRVMYIDQPMRALGGRSNEDVFMVGGLFSAAIYHFDGSILKEQSRNLYPGWAPALSDIWISPNGEIFALIAGLSISEDYVYFDGIDWRIMSTGLDTGQLDAVWGTSATNVYAVGFPGIVYHFDGVEWTEVAGHPATVTLYDIWGTSAANIFAVGESGHIYRWDGVVWSPSRIGTSDLHAVWGTCANNVFAAGYGGTIFHFNGSSWTEMSNTGVVSGIVDIHGTSDDNIYFTGTQTYRYDGGTFQELVHAPPLRALHVRRDSRIYGVGDNGEVWCSEDYGDNWVKLENKCLNHLYAIGEEPNGSLVMVGDNATIMRYTGTAVDADASSEVEFNSGCFIHSAMF